MKTARRVSSDSRSGSVDAKLVSRRGGGSTGAEKSSSPDLACSLRSPGSETRFRLANARAFSSRAAVFGPVSQTILHGDRQLAWTRASRAKYGFLLSLSLSFSHSASLQQPYSDSRRMITSIGIKLWKFGPVQCSLSLSLVFGSRSTSKRTRGSRLVYFYAGEERNLKVGHTLEFTCSKMFSPCFCPFANAHRGGRVS